MPSRHSAVEFAGYATRLVPSRGHSALIPEAFGLAGLRTPHGNGRAAREWGGLTVPFTVSLRSRRQGLRADSAGSCCVASLAP